MSAALNFEVISLKDVPTHGLIPASERYRPMVLVVDDEHVIADTLSIILRRSGFSTMTAYDGESALELASAICPELLLSDVKMGPGMDGTELAMAVVSAFPECKVLLFSGNAATRDLLDRASASGHNFTLLTKPLHPADLLARINESLQSVRSAPSAL